MAIVEDWHRHRYLMISCYFRCLVIFFGRPGATRSTTEAPQRLPRSSEDAMCSQNGSQPGHFWVHLGTKISKWSPREGILVTFLRTLRKQRKWSHFGTSREGVRRVPVSTGARFSILQPNPKRAPKWEPKWSVLGSQIRTILTLGHHLGEIGAQKAASKNECRI